MGSGRAITVLHLSDLHFGRHHRFDADEGLSSLLDRLRQDLDERRDRDGLRPDLLVVSGDLAEYGKKEEFDRAHRFLQALARLLELPTRRVVLIPGNHDINWNKSRAYFEDCAGDEVAPVEPYFRKFIFYKQLFDRFYEGEPGLTFTEEEPWTFFEYPDLGVVVAGLNSVIAESHREGDHYGFVGERQMRAFAEKLRPYKERGFLRVGVMHHDPFQRGTPRAEQDSRDLSRLLRPSLNLVLHGDVHEERLQWLYGNVPVFGVGSAAVGVSQRAPEIPNEYEILQIHAAGVRWGLRAYVPDQGRWVGSPRADAEGERWIQEIPVAFERVEALGAAGGPAPATDLERVVESYRQAIARNQGMPTVFDLLGVNEAGESAGGLDFLQVFVPQDAVRAAPPALHREEMRERGLPPDLPEPPPPEEPRDITERFLDRALPVDELLASGSAPRLLLLGAPGAGKTALTRWLLLKQCVPGEAVPGLPEGLVPVRVEMRRFDEGHRHATSEYGFFEHLDREHGERFLSLRGESLRALAREGRLYWIFDGLDEVVEEERRRRYAEMIAGLLHEYPACRVLVTSRLAGAEIARPLLERAGCATYTLQDFTDVQRDRFLDAWHTRVFAGDRTARQHRRERIARALENAPPLAEICKNPLLCALLAYLNREEELPQRRHRLYQKLLERMAEHWDANKGLPSRPDVERFDLETKLLFLRRLAWQMHEDALRGAGNAIEQGDLEDFAARFCEQRWGQAPDAARRTAEALLRQLRERNYVLAFFGGTTYGFAHRTFLDYLAAVEAHERFRGREWEIADLGKLFAARWRDPAWEEALLLLCGLLQDTNPDHVIRVLQGVPGKDLALVYGSLSDYLAFCIKALGEISVLDRGIPHEFAKVIGDVLELQLRKDVLQPWLLLEAFRRCAGRWPQSEVDRMVAATQAVMAERLFVDELYPCWIAAAGHARRLSVLLNALKHPGVMPYLVCREASTLGPWSEGEIQALCKVAEERNELERYNILASFIFTRGMTWAGSDLPIRLLHEIMRRTSDSWLGEQCAWVLLHAGCHRDEVLSYLRCTLNSEEDQRVERAALALADVGYGVDVISHLARYAPASPDCMVRLAKLSDTEAAARQELGAAITRMREGADLRSFLRITRAAAAHGFSLVSDQEILDRLQDTNNLEVTKDALRLMTLMPTLCPLAVRVYQWLYTSAPSISDFSRIESDIKYIDPRHGGPALIDLWAGRLVSDDFSVSIPMAGHILRTLHEPALRARARQLLLRFVGEEHPDTIRLLAARNLGIDDPIGREAHRALAWGAQNESDRLTAACFVGDLDALNALAEKATHAQRRTLARHALDLYAHISFLLHVGRPRRARVRLHDRDVGVLEETAAGAGTRFTYASAYLAAPGARPLAPNLPLRPEPYESDTLHSFFANLLPEGPLYDQTARRLGLRRTDRFGMLLKVGGDVMGAVQVLPEEDA